MLDIYACLKKRLVPAGSPIPVGKTYLIEMYSEVTSTPRAERSELLLPGAYVDSDALGEDWPIVGREPVNPEDVEFPEGLIGFMHPEGEAAFQCGEIYIPVPLETKDLYEIDEWTTIHSTFLWPFTCLILLGRGTEVPPDYKTATIKRADLRYSPHRSRIYQYLPFQMDQTYFSKQAQLGLHLERLYEA